MTPKEAKLKYGKDISRQIWEEFDLSIINAVDTPEGIDIKDYEWENGYYKIIGKQ